MDNNGRNGLRNNEALEDLEDALLDEDDIIETIVLEDGVEQNGEAAVAADMDMLDVDGEDEENYDDEGGDVAMVIQPERDDAKLVFSRHTGSVFCVAVTSDHGQLAVTGGEDDKAYVWKLSTGDVILECTGHKDSVTCVSFSSGATHVATGDLSGLIQVWDMQQLKLVWSFEVSDLEWLSWHTVAPVLLAGTVEGDMWMWKLPGGDTKTFQSFGCSCNIGKVMPDGKRCVSGYADGSVRVWDLKTGAATHSLTGGVGHANSGHAGSITSISCHSDNSLVMTGSTDCTSILMNPNVGKVMARLQCKVEQAGEGVEYSVESVGLSNVFPYAGTGTLSGHLCIWDVPTQVCRQQCKHDAGIVKLEWHESEPLLYTCSLDGAVQTWDARTGNRERQWLGHEASILDMTLADNGNAVVTTSDDHSSRVFRL